VSSGAGRRRRVTGNAKIKCTVLLIRQFCPWSVTRIWLLAGDLVETVLEYLAAKSRNFFSLCHRCSGRIS